MVHQAASGTTYAEMIVEGLSRFPSREAFVHGDRRLTYAQCADVISRIQQVLQGRGVSRGHSVAALGPNMPEVWLAQAAAYLLGASYSGLHALGSVDDHVHLCDDAGIDVLIVHPMFAEVGAAVYEGAKSVRHLLTLGPADVGENLLVLSDAMVPRPLDPGPAALQDTAWLQYTGGTTGRPKGVMLPHRAMAQMTLSFIVSAGVPEVPRYLAASPISHAASVPIVPVLLRGGTVVLHDSFDPDAWLRTVQDERINFGLAVPAMLNAVLDHGKPSTYDLSSLETVTYGAAPMSPDRIAEAHEALGHVLLQVYGQTECAAVATTLRKDEHDPVGLPELLSSCGRAMAGVRVEVLDEASQVVPVGEVGEICTRSAAVMTGYRNLPDQTANALRDGWLHTGDLAKRDERGFLHIVDRMKDMIISGGFNVYPKEVEDVIAGHPGVSSVAVIGVPDEKWGEAVTAFVVPRPGAQIDGDAIARLVRERKGAHQTPKQVNVVDQLPSTAVGKVDKKALRAEYWADEERGVH